MIEEKPIAPVVIPSLDEIDEYAPVLTPMDKKTIVNAITKRMPEVRKVNLVEKDKANYRYQLVIVCQLLHEVTILIEDDFNMMMRHKDLMNLVDTLSFELGKRKKGLKNNKLPNNFFRDSQENDFKKYKD